MKQLNLFDEPEKSKNINSEIFDYRPGIFTKPESKFFMEKLIKETTWNQRTVLMYGKEVVTPRLTAWFGNPSKNLLYENNSHLFPWTNELLLIKERIENLSSIRFDSVLLNYYRDGNDSVSWHSDNDGVPGKNKFVASVSFGQERAFDIRNKNDHNEKFSIMLEDGSYILMKNDFQENWQHRIAKSKAKMKERLNLTFRIINA